MIKICSIMFTWNGMPPSPRNRRTSHRHSPHHSTTITTNATHTPPLPFQTSFCTFILHHTLSYFTTHFHTSAPHFHTSAPHFHTPPHTFTLHHTLSYFNLHFHTPPYVFKRFQIISNPFPFLFSLMHGGKPPPARLEVSLFW